MRPEVRYSVSQICNQSSVSHTTDGPPAAGGDFIGTTCLTTFTAGSIPGTFSIPQCDITINDDDLVEQNETFSINATITNSNGQSAQITAGGVSASVTIIDDDGTLNELILFCSLTS